MRSLIVSGFLLVSLGLVIPVPAVNAPAAVSAYQEERNPPEEGESSRPRRGMVAMLKVPPSLSQESDKKKQEQKEARPPDLQQKTLQKVFRSRSQKTGSSSSSPQSSPRVPVRSATTAAKGKNVEVSSKGVQLRFTETPIQTVISGIMTELGGSYVIDPEVSGSVSLYTAREVPKARLFELLEKLLKMNGQAIVKQDDLYVIVPLNQSPKIPHQVLTKPETAAEVQEPGSEKAGSPEQQSEEPESGGAAGPEPAPSTPEAESGSGSAAVVPEPFHKEREQLAQQKGVITYVIPLHYIPSSEMVKMVQPFASNGATIIDFVTANTLIVNDYRQNIQQILNLINLIDTRYFDINTIDLIPIRYSTAEDVATDLGKVFAIGEEAAGIRIISIERLNSVLVITRSPAVFQEVLDWIDKLDTPSTSTNVKTYVYQVENNTAMNIAEVLAQLYDEGLPTDESRPTETRDTLAAQRTLSPMQDQTQGRFLGNNQRGFQGGFGGSGFGIGPTLGGRAARQGIRAVVSGDLKIIVNEFNNSLIIQATEADYQFLLETIKQLDVLPRQVLIEAKIYSVELRDDLSFGVAAFLQERASGDAVSVPTAGEITAPAQMSTGGTISITSRAFIGQARQLEGIINALRFRTNVEILEAPRLLALDGMQAQINVGAEVPVTTASFGDPLRSGSSTSFINSIQFRPTGTTLLIMPRISSSGVVTLDLAIEVSSATGTALTPTINRNYIQTSLIVQDGQTVAIAGIISDHADSEKSRVPLLGDIPILGVLFGQTTRNARRSELIFFITPSVVRNLPTATELTLDFKRALRNAYETIGKAEETEDLLIERRRQEEAQDSR